MPEFSGWLAWLVVGAIALFVVGVAVRTVVAARFPKGYRRWAAERRESFVARSDEFDRADDEFRR